MAATEKTDWKVQVILDRDTLVADIAKLAKILARQRVAVMVSASNREDAEERAKQYLRLYIGIPEVYLKTLHPRRLPT